MAGDNTLTKKFVEVHGPLSKSVARGRHKLESVLDSLDSSLRTERACFHLRVLVFPARGKTCRIEPAFCELEYPNVLPMRPISVGFRHERRVDHCHGCKIRKPVHLVNLLGHRRAKKIDVMREDNHEIHFCRIGSGAYIREQLLSV